MANVTWRMKGQWMKNCNCAAGCPCDFNERPTHGHCEGMVGMRIEEGVFGDTDLSGLHWACVYYWPGALHEGNGTIKPILDANASEEQIAALGTILTGQEQVEGTFFHIVSLIISTVLEPELAEFEFEFNLEDRTARFAAPGLFETVTEPIKNPVTGDDHRAQVHLPSGFEYFTAEIAKASVNKGLGEIAYDCPDTHSSLAVVEHTDAGTVPFV